MEELFKDESTMLIIAVGMLVFSIAMLWGKIATNKINRQDSGEDDKYNCPLTVEEATVLSKIDSQNPTSIFAEYSHAVFETKNGKRFKFAVKNKSAYDSLIVGDVGMLHHKGNYFVSFEQQKRSTDE